MIEVKKPHRAVAIAVAMFCATCVAILGLRVAANYTLIDESAVAVWNSLTHGSIAFAITFALVFVGASALGAIVVVLGWLLKTVTDAVHNFNEGQVESYKGLRDTALVLLAVSGLALCLTNGMNAYNAANIRSGFIASAMMGQINNFPKSESRMLAADLRAGKWYKTATDSAIMAFFKSSYRLINWTDRAKVEAFLDQSLSRPWDIPVERPVSVTLGIENGKVRYTFHAYGGQRSSGVSPAASKRMTLIGSNA